MNYPSFCGLNGVGKPRTIGGKFVCVICKSGMVKVPEDEVDKLQWGQRTGDRDSTVPVLSDGEMRLGMGYDLV